jgi:hypothetical protein
MGSPLPDAKIYYQLREGKPVKPRGVAAGLRTRDEGQWFNAGAWWIPCTHTGVLNYCKELGVCLEIFVKEADASYFYYEGAAAGLLANRRVRLREVKADIGAAGVIASFATRTTVRHERRAPRRAECCSLPTSARSGSSGIPC